MTREQVEKAIGKIIYENDDFVVRGKFDKIKCQLFVNVKDDDGNEELPRGYILGSSSLTRSRP